MAARALGALAALAVCCAACASTPAPTARWSHDVPRPVVVEVPEAPRNVITEPVPIVDATAPQLPAAAADPERVRVPALGIDMPVESVGVAADGQMQVPDDALEAGWYSFGSAPGQPGSAVVAAHAGSTITPRGPFYDLRWAEPGMSVDVELADGSSALFEIVSVEVLTKADLDLRPYFDRDGEARLALITCGGQWDDAAQSYLSNVVVTARLAGG